MTRNTELDDAPEQSTLPELRDGETVTVTKDLRQQGADTD